MNAITISLPSGHASLVHRSYVIPMATSTDIEVPISSAFDSENFFHWLLLLCRQPFFCLESICSKDDFL